MAGEQEELTTIIVADQDRGRRLDVCVTGRLGGGMSRSRVARLIDAGAVTLNGAPAKARDLVETGDRIVVRHIARPPSTLMPIALPLSILFEDDDVIVVDKPAGLSVHPGAGTAPTTPTLVQALLHHAGKLATASARDPQAVARPGIVHRLDKDTTGVIVCAKTEAALTDLARQFHDKTEVVREYAALLDGAMPKKDIVHESYLHRDPTSRLRFASLDVATYRRRATLGELKGRYRYAKSHFGLQTDYDGRLTLARIRLFTGRTHQIRVHAKDLRLPVVGDLVYHRVTELPLTFPEILRARLRSLKRQLLHARSLTFRHPRTRQLLVFESAYPADFAEILALLSPFARPPADQK